MRKSRRQIVNRIAEAAGLGLVVLSLVMFFAVYRPLGNKIDAAVRVHTELRQTIRNQQVRVDILKRFEAELPQAGTGIEAFEADRTPARREAYSTADHLVHKMADAAGVKLSTIAFHLDVGRKGDPSRARRLPLDDGGLYAPRFVSEP